MAIISIRLFGPLEFTAENKVITNLLNDKERALLAYLVKESDCPQSREALGSLFWPNRPERAARQSLRQALYQVRRLMKDRDDNFPHLQVNKDTIQFFSNGDAWIDVNEFANLIRAYQLHHPQEDQLCALCITRLNRAASLFRGDFMTGLSLPDASQFDLWQIIHREAFHLQIIDILTVLTNHYLLHQDFNRVVSFSQHMIQIDPSLERAHRLLMRALALQGRRCEALHQFEICSMILQRELGVAPSTETNQLYMKIRENQSFPLYDGKTGDHSDLAS